MAKTQYTRQTLEETPVRMLQFLAAVGTVPAIRAALSARGYDDAEHQTGWKLLHGASGYDPATAAPVVDRSATEALAQLDAWDEPNFRLAQAALARHFPAQGEFVFKNLAPQTGAKALLSVKTFLDRIDQLEGKLPGRETKDKAQVKADKAAVTLLATRGIVPAERARLRQLISTAETGGKVDPELGRKLTDADQKATARNQALVELRSFFDEWTQVARIVITRRDHLIRLGLAQRKLGNKPDEEQSDEPTDPEPPTP